MAFNNSNMKGSIWWSEDNAIRLRCEEYWGGGGIMSSPSRSHQNFMAYLVDDDLLTEDLHDSDSEDSLVNFSDNYVPIIDELKTSDIDEIL